MHWGESHSPNARERLKKNSSGNHNCMAMSSKLDKIFIKKLHKRLVETEKRFFPSDPELKRVPSPEHLEEIISTILWASTKFEEGRPLRFSVTYTDPFPVEHLALTFDIPLKGWDVEELR